MARVTVEECLDDVESRFELVMVAAQRAKDIVNGTTLTIEREGEKNSVLALREIEKKTVDPQVLREELIKGYQDHADVDALPLDQEGLEAGIGEEGDVASGEVADELEGADGFSFEEENLDVDD